MFDKIIAAYKKAEMSLMNKFSGIENDIINEVTFYDVGYMQTQIGAIQHELKDIDDKLKPLYEINDNNKYKKDIDELLDKRNKELYLLIFFASNSFANIDECIKMGQKANYDFMQCVRGIKAYMDGDKNTAFNLIDSYYRQHGFIKKHYLANKVYGILIKENGNCTGAIKFLLYAFQFLPDDAELLNELKFCYQQIGELKNTEIISSALSVLNRNKRYS